MQPILRPQLDLVRSLLAPGLFMKAGNRSPGALTLC
jgi:hypothetical protein